MQEKTEWVLTLSSDSDAWCECCEGSAVIAHTHMTPLPSALQRLSCRCSVDSRNTWAIKSAGHQNMFPHPAVVLKPFHPPFPQQFNIKWWIWQWILTFSSSCKASRCTFSKAEGSHHSLPLTGSKTFCDRTTKTRSEQNRWSGHTVSPECRFHSHCHQTFRWWSPHFL